MSFTVQLSQEYDTPPDAQRASAILRLAPRINRRAPSAARVQRQGHQLKYVAVTLTVDRPTGADATMYAMSLIAWPPHGLAGRFNAHAQEGTA